MHTPEIGWTMGLEGNQTLLLQGHSCEMTPTNIVLYSSTRLTHSSPETLPPAVDGNRGGGPLLDSVQRVRALGELSSTWDVSIVLCRNSVKSRGYEQHQGSHAVKTHRTHGHCGSTDRACIGSNLWVPGPQGDVDVGSHL